MNHFEFASDNTAGMAPEALAAFIEANGGFCPSYSADQYTIRAVEAFRALFNLPCEAFFVSTGTAANSLALAQMCRSHQATICHAVAHIETDECGAPGFFGGGMKLLAAPGENAKLSPSAVQRLATERRDVHSPLPRALSLTLPTEAGTVYSIEELRVLRDVARENKLSIHLDGARFSNAVASLGGTPRDVIEASGADVLCFGGTKGGLALSEAVLFFNVELAHEFDYRCKQAGQLASKMRLLSAPWTTMLNGGHWLRYAKMANDAAQNLEKIFLAQGLEALYPVEANTVFVKLPSHVDKKLRERGWHYYPFFEGAARFMCSWNVDSTVLDAFERDLKSADAD